MSSATEPAPGPVPKRLPDPPSTERPVPAPARFFALVFLVSWLWWVPLMLVRLRVLPAPEPMGSLTALALPGVLVPAIVGVLLTARYGRGAVRGLLASLARWRFGAAWWVAVVLQPVVLLLVTGLLIITGLGAPHPPDGTTIAAVGVTAVFLLIASVGEELGWRGVALPGLLRRMGPLAASLVLGVLVAVWHVPYWILQGVLAQYGPAYLLLDLVFVVALTFQLTWLFLRSGGACWPPSPSTSRSTWSTSPCCR